MFWFLKRRAFCIFEVAALVSQLGSGVLTIALPLYVYHLTGSALATSGLFIASLFPRLLLGMVGGMAVDRWGTRRVLVAADLIRAVLVLSLLAVHSGSLVWIVYAFSLVQGCIAQAFMAARSATIPALVETSELTGANAVDTTIGGVTRFLAPPLGAALLVTVGFASIIAADSLSFLASGGCLAVLHYRGAAIPRQRPEGAVARRLLGELGEGLSSVRQNPTISLVFMAVGTVMAGYGVITVLLVVFARVVFRAQPLAYGWLSAGQGVGLVAGALLVGGLRRLARPEWLLAGFLGLTGLAFLITFAVDSLGIAVIAIAAAGACISGWAINERALLQGAIDPAQRGRVFGLYATLNSALTLAGMAIAGSMEPRAGVLPLLDAAAVTYIVAGLVVGLRVRATS